MLAAMEPLQVERIPLFEARGRRLAAPVIAQRAQPPFAASAMDGFALRATDTPGELRIVGESAAGHAFTRVLGEREAVRISTGAPLPDGADAVLIQEEARIEGEMLIVDALTVGRHVRGVGVDFKSGAEILLAGARLDPAELALAAAAGTAVVDTWRAPRVDILCAGDEIVPPGEAPRADQIFESCSYAIAAYAEAWGATVQRRYVLPDDAKAIERAAQETICASDLVVFIGAASVGPHDHAKPAFEALGARLLVSKVDMRPGKPTWFATTKKAPVLGLPGNPASAIVASMLFLKPLLERMLGCGGVLSVKHARVTAPLTANGSREAYLRAHVEIDEQGQARITAAKEQDSSLLSVLAASSALILRPANAPAAAVHDVVPWIALS